jgi:hypothetical protein
MSEFFLSLNVCVAVIRNDQPGQAIKKFNRSLIGIQVLERVESKKGSHVQEQG